MPSPFNGKWRAIEVTGGKEFVEAVNSPEAYRLKLKALAEAVRSDPEFYIEELHVNEEAGTIHRKVHIKGHPGKDFGEKKFGVEHDGHMRDERPAKVKLELESPHKIVGHEHAEGVHIFATSEVVGDHMIVTAVGNGATSVAKFVKV